jgi:hypothetical protein
MCPLRHAAEQADTRRVAPFDAWDSQPLFFAIAVPVTAAKNRAGVT